jgi:hypothetical protein
MTHVENVAHILKYGITHRNSPKRNANYVPIGDVSLISARNMLRGSVGKELGAYTPFYFGPRMPMLYVIQNGFNGVQRIPAADIVYCVTSLERIVSEGLDFLFSDGHALAAFTNLYGPDKVGNIRELLDWNAINARYWNDEGDLDLKRRKEAEFLVLGDVPASAIEGFIVYSAEARERILGIKRYDGQDVSIKPNCYF